MRRSVFYTGSPGRGSLLSSSAALFVIFIVICILSAFYMPLVEAQSTTPSSIPPPSTSSSISPLPTPSPSQRAPPPSQPPGTRELQDSQAIADKFTQGQLQTYHFSVAQRQHLPVRRQLERIIFHPSLEKRQATRTTGPTSTSESTTAVLPTRTISPAVPAPFENGTYAVFISISTCSTPKSGTGEVCPSLVLYVSDSPAQPMPGPGQEAQGVLMVSGQEGLIQFTAYTTGDLFFSLQAPPLEGFSGDWAVEVGASSQGYVQRYQNSPGLLLDDTDSVGASFLTHNFTKVPTFKVYLVNTSALPQGLTQSLCAIEAIQPVPLSETTMTVTPTNRTSNIDGSMGTEIIPAEARFEEFGQRRQVLILSLTPGTRYTAIFVTDAPNQAGAEVMYSMTSFRTKRRDNCILITDLTFCHEVAYAVPVTPLSTLPNNNSGGSAGGLNSSMIQQDVKAFYDDFANNLMDNFGKVLAQYDCTKSQYSLIRNCTDCTRAYRRWVCSVSIPRCTDVEDVIDPNNIGYSAAPPAPEENPYLEDRSQGPVVAQRDTASSRGAIAQLPQNPLMNPGTYGEVLPCIDLCFDVVQSCPNFLGFNCPVKNMAGNYASMNSEGFQCNGLGVVPVPSSARSKMDGVSGALWMAMLVTAVAIVPGVVGW